LVSPRDETVMFVEGYSHASSAAARFCERSLLDVCNYVAAATAEVERAESAAV
jgi:hypothetical protein